MSNQNLTITMRKRWLTPGLIGIPSAPLIEIVLLTPDMHTHDAEAKVIATIHPDFSHLADDIADMLNKPKFVKKVTE
jgi:hypothetical protein